MAAAYERLMELVARGVGKGQADGEQHTPAVAARDLQAAEGAPPAERQDRVLGHMRELAQDQFEHAV